MNYNQKELFQYRGKAIEHCKMWMEGRYNVAQLFICRVPCWHFCYNHPLSLSLMNAPKVKCTCDPCSLIEKGGRWWNWKILGWTRRVLQQRRCLRHRESQCLKLCTASPATSTTIRQVFVLFIEDFCMHQLILKLQLLCK